MPSRRDVVLDAAIGVLARGGARALSHRTVDAAAGLPSGSTSNLFRTRPGLVAGVLGRLTERERSGLAALGVSDGTDGTDGTDDPIDAAVLTTIAASMIDDALGPGRVGSLARRALFHEASQDPAVAAQLLDATRFWWTVTAGLLARAGVADADARARLLLAYVDGVIADQLARPDEDFDAVRSIAPAVHGVVTHSDPV